MSIKCLFVSYCFVVFSQVEPGHDSAMSRTEYCYNKNPPLKCQHSQSKTNAYSENVLGMFSEEDRKGLESQHKNK